MLESLFENKILLISGKNYLILVNIKFSRILNKMLFFNTFHKLKKNYYLFNYFDHHIINN